MHGARHEKLCIKITTADGQELGWVDEIRYLLYRRKLIHVYCASYEI